MSAPTLASISTPVTGASSSQYRIIVGIDYGTTNSGISYVTTNKASDDIVIVDRWPNHRDRSWKAPSVIAYASENPKITRNHWGYEVTGGMKQYAWTKLLLDSSVKLSSHDDPLLQAMYGSEGFLKLPAGKSAQDVIRDFLREVYKHTVQTLEREFPPEVFRTLPMECWITMPAIWSDAAQLATQKAALAAGFGSRPNDTVNMIPEPEAAALWALKPYLGESAIDPLKVGEHVLICDCGGGTVDLVTYEITQTTPFLAHREKCVGTGAKCGATSVDRHFVSWMEQKFGTAYTELPAKKRGPGSPFMQAFESQKRNFGDQKDGGRDYYEVGPIVMTLDGNNLKYDDDEQAVKISRHDMKSFFDPAIKKLKLKLDEQVQLLARKGAKIDRFILVGGFADSPYLSKSLKSWCTHNNVRRFTCPIDCQAAIVKGAALRGLEGIRPTSIISKRHYGWSWHTSFRPGLDREEHAWIDPWDGSKRCKGRMHWVVKKGQELDANFKIRESAFISTHELSHIQSSLGLYSSAEDEGPDRVEHHGVRHEGTIITTFSGTSEAQGANYNRTLSAHVYKFNFEVEVDFRSQSGILGFKSYKGDREAGTTTINFNN